MAKNIFKDFAVLAGMATVLTGVISVTAAATAQSVSGKYEACANEQMSQQIDYTLNVPQTYTYNPTVVTACVEGKVQANQNGSKIWRNLALGFGAVTIGLGGAAVVTGRRAGKPANKPS